MAVIKTLAVNLVARTAAFEKGMKRSGRQLKGFQKTAAATSVALKSLAASFGLIGAGMATFKIVNLASEAEEIMSKFDTVFGRLNDQAREWTENFSKSIGRATSEVANSMATLQDTFVPLGFAREKAFELSKSLVQLATDVASFNNKADSDVLRDFTSALVGSQETVRKYGIILSVATLEQEALRQGMTKSFTELSELEKVFLRYSVIMRNTSDAQGDAVRTASSYANQVKKMKAAISDLSVEMGNVLLPAMSESVSVMTKFVKVLDRTFDLLKIIGNTIVGVGQVALATFTAMLGGIGKVVDKIAELGFGLDINIGDNILDLARDIKGLGDENFVQAMEQFKSAFSDSPGLSAMPTKLSKVSAAMEDLATSSKETIREIKQFKTTIDSLIESIKSPEEKFSDFLDVVSRAFSEGMVTVQQFDKLIEKAYDRIFDIGRIKSFADSIKQSLKGPFELLSDFNKDLMEAVDEGLLSFIEAKEAFKRFGDDLFPQPALASAGGGGGRSEAIRTSLVSVAGLSGGANPQVRAQEKTNIILEDQTRILREIEQKESLG